MQGSYKPSTIHVNPMFKETSKNVIHINPKVHINMAIHVNPRMVNAHALTHGGIQQRMIPDTFVNSKRDCQESPSVQKSVYVNPRLMEKLTSRIPDVEIVEEICRDEAQAKIQSSRLGVDGTRPEVFVEKSPSPNLVSLSRRKLVRIPPKSSPQSSMKIVGKNCGNILAQKSVGKIQIRKITRGKQLKKVNGSNQLGKVNVVRGKVNSTLKKINNVLGQSKRINREVGTLRKVNNVKVTLKSSASSSKGSGSKYKIDRTTGAKKTKAGVTRRTLGSNNKNLVNIDGVFYRSSKSRLVKSSCSSASPKPPKKPTPASSRPRKLRTHVVINGKIAKINTSNLRKTILQTPGQKSNYKHVISNRVKQRSLQILRHKMCKNNQPCLLFQRFGYCAKHIKGTCPKVHDKKQVALCKNFLQGKCLLDNCPLSHDVGPEKMPTCKYFLEGCCTRDNCQYLHVKVSANTPICVPFLRGYCAKGDQCKERHTNICPEFDKYGKCAKGKNCPYPHKTCLLPQQNTLRLPRPLNSFNKPRSLRKSVDISSHDDSKKRYYDDSCSNDALERKKSNINKKIRVMKMVHKSSEEPDVSVITGDTEMKSQPIAEEVRPRRPPIGPLPSYIPIN
ncbi:zinc finger CCCH domain-containing protein 3 [Diachasma alloeum]|uniref:zinc finger CCCH domain-containing protein 3 n=1 Tax=Diachasma alloeum TaxID=454923 RepID=UPI000738340D|nr:zinc finger CCCH domain-containing protein 3 [Diachasma alloeum]